MRLELTFAEWMGLLTTVGILATFGLSLYIWLRHTRPSRKVKVALVEELIPAPEGFRGAVAIIFINERGPSVVVQEVGFLCADPKKWIVKSEFLKPHDDPLPKEVAPGDNAKYYFDLEKLRRVIEEGKSIAVRAYCRDAIEQVYQSPYLNRYLNRQINSALLE